MDNRVRSSSCYKTTWQEIRPHVIEVNESLSQLIDELDPPRSYELYRVAYSYGEYIHYHGFRFPDNLKYLKQKLLYTDYHLPIGIVLKNTVEIYCEVFDKIIPRGILHAGDVFGLSSTTIGNVTRSTLHFCRMTSGVRNIVMVPAISDVVCHKNLVRDFAIQYHPPKLLQDHWSTFKAIIKAKKENDWGSELLLFSEKWEKYLFRDKAWRNLKEYLITSVNNKLNYYQNLWLLEALFYHVLQKKNFKPDPYSVDTVLHLIAIACGVEFGFKFTGDDQLAPITIIQQAYVESYKLKYHPIVMCPSLFQYTTTKHPVYYSFHYPSCCALSPRMRRTSHIIHNLVELQQIVSAFIEELKQCDIAYPLINKIATDVMFSCFHTQADKNNNVKSTAEILNFDSGVKQSVSMFNENYFPSNGLMLRGCVAVST